MIIKNLDFSQPKKGTGQDVRLVDLNIFTIHLVQQSIQGFHFENTKQELTHIVVMLCAKEKTKSRQTNHKAVHSIKNQMALIQ